MTEYVVYRSMSSGGYGHLMNVRADSLRGAKRKARRKEPDATLMVVPERNRHIFRY